MKINKKVNSSIHLFSEVNIIHQEVLNVDANNILSGVWEGVDTQVKIKSGSIWWTAEEWQVEGDKVSKTKQKKAIILDSVMGSDSVKKLLQKFTILGIFLLLGDPDS